MTGHNLACMNLILVISSQIQSQCRHGWPSNSSSDGLFCGKDRFILCEFQASRRATKALTAAGHVLKRTIPNSPNSNLILRDNVWPLEGVLVRFKNGKNYLIKYMCAHSVRTCSKIPHQFEIAIYGSPMISNVGR